APRIALGANVRRPAPERHNVRLKAEHVSVRYGAALAINDVSLDVHDRAVTAIIGPSGCGKSTLLRVFNRMNDLIPSARTEDRLRSNATGLSGGQQQRLCIARALAVEPNVILMDEPCSALDPRATLKVEDLMTDLARDYTIVIVTHNMQQAARVSQYTAFMLA